MENKDGGSVDGRPDISERSIIEIASDIAKLLASLASLFVFASVLHEYVYFWTIGKEFLQIYSVTDFAKLSVSWLPVTLILGSLGFLVSFYDLNARFEAVRMHGERGLEAWRKSDKAMRYIVIITVLLVFLSLPQITWETITVIQLPIFVGIIYAIGRQISNGRLPLTHRPAEGIMLYGFVAWLLLGALFGGLIEGIRDVKRNEPLYHVKFREQSTDIVILRAVDKGLIYKLPKQNQVNFAIWNNVREIQSGEIFVSDRTLIGFVKDWMFKGSEK